MQSNKLPIGVFDSGVGGITVLAELIRLLPNERFLYYGDELHAPYGVRPREEVCSLTLQAMKFLYNTGMKAAVVACNTATSAAIKDIRTAFPIPVLGMEPALKPAVKLNARGKIVVMATPLTIKGKKFQNLLDQYGSEADVVPLPCPGLVEIIENEELHSEKLKGYLQDLFAEIGLENVGAVVLGCTHYLFIKSELVSIVAGDVAIVDGNEGTARHLAKTLDKAGLLSVTKPEENEGQVCFFTSGEESIELPKYRYFLDYALKYIYPE